MTNLRRGKIPFHGCWRRLVVLMMDEDDLLSRLEELRCAFTDFDTALKKALGFTETITYKEIRFHVSPYLVIADLSPLAFLNLVEPMDNDGAEAAVVRLYDRLLPLLACRHHWSDAATPLDKDGRPIPDGPVQGTMQTVVCEFCTAYAIRGPGAELPTVGRSVRADSR